MLVQSMISLVVREADMEIEREGEREECTWLSGY